MSRLSSLRRPRFRFPASLRFRIPFRTPFRFPVLTTGERAAAIVLAALIGTGAALHAWERAGVRFGPVEDMDTLRTWVLQARAEQGDPEFPCDDLAGGRTGARIATAAPPSADATPAARGTPATAKPAAAVPVDLNAADEKALIALPGIGPATAKAILEHRAARGRFNRVEDLLAVRGIGPRKLEALRGHVQVKPPPAREAPKPAVTADSASRGGDE